MDRRRLLAAAAGLALAAPRGALAQSRPVVAILRASAWAQPNLRDFLIYGIREQGREEGHDFDVVDRSTEGDPTRAPPLVAELLALHPAIIVPTTTELAVQLHRATSAIPIVAPYLTDPVRLGLVENLAHPGGNVTGLLSTSATGGKLLELMQQIVPGLSKVGLLFNPTNVAQRGRATETQAAPLGIAIVRAPATVVAEIEPAMKSLVAEGVGAVFVGQDALFSQELKPIAELALAARLPTIYGFRALPDAGGLIGYGGSLPERWRHIGWYVAKILKGDKPGDLPVEQQEKLELVINMKTAKALGLTIPPVVLTRADELIE